MPINYGVLNPETTAVYGSPESFHVLLRGQKGDAGCPYSPEVVQRRNNTFHAVLGITLRWVNPPNPLPPPWGEETDLEKACLGSGTFRFPEDESVLTPHELELVLMKMPRPGAPQGVESNATGGAVSAKEDVTGAMLRKHKEELLGMSVIASSIISPFEQYCSGAYREWYTLGVVLAVGEPAPSPDEQARGIVSIPLPMAMDWIAEQNARSQVGADFCAVDGKVSHGLLLMARRFKWVL